MRELLEIAPDVDFLLGLGPEALGARLMFLLRARGNQLFNPGYMAKELWNLDVPAHAPYSVRRREAVDLAIRAAWNWLGAQGFIVSADNENGRNGFCVFTNRGRKFKNSNCSEEVRSLGIAGGVLQFSRPDATKSS
jgi:hypothetical protein